MDPSPNTLSLSWHILKLENTEYLQSVVDLGTAKESGVLSPFWSKVIFCISFTGRYLEMSIELFVGEVPLDSESEDEMKLKLVDNGKDWDGCWFSMNELAHCLDCRISEWSSSKVTQFLKRMGPCYLVFVFCLLNISHRKTLFIQTNFKKPTRHPIIWYRPVLGIRTDSVHCTL